MAYYNDDKAYVTALELSNAVAMPEQLSKAPGGYPKLAALMNSSPSDAYQICRRFGNLNSRCLLYLQDELSELESILQQYDSSEHQSTSRRYDQHPDRGNLIAHITTKITQYSEWPQTSC